MLEHWELVSDINKCEPDHRYNIIYEMTGWCDYLVCDPVACPQEMSAAEQWRRAQRNYAGQFSLDLFGDLDPEAPTENWI